MRAFKNRCMFALMVTALFSIGAVLLSPGVGLCTEPPPLPTYYLTVEKTVDQPSVTLAINETKWVTFTIRVFFNVAPPDVGCYLPFDETRSVTINDTLKTEQLGHIYYDDIPASLVWEYSYSHEVGPYEECGDETIENIVTMAYNPLPESCQDKVTVNVQVLCDQPGTGTPGYWMNHPEAWPAAATTITVGCIEYTKDEAIASMKDPVKGDKFFTMFPALVAAKLNVMIGNDASCIAATIAAADAWLCEYGLGEGIIKGEPWALGEPLYWELDDYNNGYLCAPSRDEFD